MGCKPTCLGNIATSALWGKSARSWCPGCKWGTHLLFTASLYPGVPCFVDRSVKHKFRSLQWAVRVPPPPVSRVEPLRGCSCDEHVCSRRRRQIRSRYAVGTTQHRNPSFVSLWRSKQGEEWIHLKFERDVEKTKKVYQKALTSKWNGTNMCCMQMTAGPAAGEAAADPLPRDDAMIHRREIASVRDPPLPDPPAPAMGEPTGWVLAEPDGCGTSVKQDWRFSVVGNWTVSGTPSGSDSWGPRQSNSSETAQNTWKGPQSLNRSPHVFAFRDTNMMLWRGVLSPEAHGPRAAAGPQTATGSAPAAAAVPRRSAGDVAAAAAALRTTMTTQTTTVRTSAT